MDPTIYVFIDNDEGYRRWFGAHVAGFIIHTRRRSRGTLNLHRADCWHVTVDDRTGPLNWTGGQAAKICSESRAALEAYARELHGQSVKLCQSCEEKGD